MNDVASFTVPINGAGTYSYAVSYPGDSQIATFDRHRHADGPAGPGGNGGGYTDTDADAATPAAVSRIKVKKVAGSVIKASTSTTAGKYRVKITSPSGKAAATRQGDDQGPEGRDDQDHHRQALGRCRHLHGAEADLWDVEGRDLVGRQLRLPARLGDRAVDQGQGCCQGCEEEGQQEEVIRSAIRLRAGSLSRITESDHCVGPGGVAPGADAFPGPTLSGPTPRCSGR